MRRLPKPCSLSALLLLLLLLGAAAPARALKYTPRADETLSHIALIHYGATKKMIYITSANGIEDPDRMPKGVSLRIPTVWRYRLRKGDDLAKIAAKHLKDPSRADFLSWLNRIKDPRKLEAGQLITIPFVLRHKVSAGQNMIQVARTYYWSTRPTGLLRKFNGKRNNTLKPGEIVYVPIYDAEAATDKVKERLKRHMDKEKEAEEEARRRALAAAAEHQSDPTSSNANQQNGLDQILSGEPDGGDAPEGQPADSRGVRSDPRSAELIRQASELYQDGEYEHARSNLAMALENGGLSKADEAEAREVMAFCLVALERDNEAEHEFVRLLMVVPERRLDPETTSPKILKVFEKARGK